MVVKSENAVMNWSMGNNEQFEQAAGEGAKSTNKSTGRSIEASPGILRRLFALQVGPTRPKPA